MGLSRRNSFKYLFYLVLFPILGGMMYATKWAMQGLPNIHLIGFFIMAFTAVYRAYALVPIYVFVFLCGVFDGFGTWWVPYLYVWTILWAVSMLLPKRLFESKWAYVVCPVISGLFGLLFGVLYAPGQAILYGYDLQQTVAWIGTGFLFDIYHGIGNFAAGFLVPPFALLLFKLEKIYAKKGSR